MKLPDVALGDLYALLGERDVNIFQLEKLIRVMEAGSQEAKTSAKPEFVKDPFKKEK